MPLVECIAFMLIKDGQVLAEKRKHTKRGCLVPSLFQAGTLRPESVRKRRCPVKRWRKSGLSPSEIAYVCTLLHRSQEFRKLHYFVVTRWEGEIIPQEAESLVWIPLTTLETLDLDVDKIGVQEYLRVYTS